MGDNSYSTGIGVTKVGTEEPVTPDTHFQIGLEAMQVRVRSPVGWVEVTKPNNFIIDYFYDKN